MTHLLTRTAAVALVAGLVGACGTTPAYPTVEGVAPGSGPRLPDAPAYATTRADAAEAGPQPYEEAGEPSPDAAPTADSARLTPVRPVGTVQVAQLAPPPVSDAAPESDDAEEAPPPAPVAAPPAPVAPVTKVVTLAPGKVVDVDGRPKTYTVREGQGLDAVARAMGSTRAELARINGLKEPYRLKPGQVIKGPADRAKAYVVAPGDTLYAIAQRFKVSAAALADENNIQLSSAIRAGQKLRLPPGYKDGGPIKKTVTVTPEPAAQAAPPPVVVAPPRLQPQPEPQPAPPVAGPPAATPPAATPARPPAATPDKPPAASGARPPAATPPSTPATRPPAPATRPSVTAPVAPKPLPPAPSVVPDDRPPTLSDDQIAALGRGRFTWPVTGPVLSDFGPKPGGQRNDGLNIGAPAGTPVRAASAGKVVYSGGDVPGFGVTVLIQHEGGWVTVYGHLARTDVRMQQMVGAGDVIGQVGSSGGVSQPQLHFEIRYSPSPKYKARAVDPALVLPQAR